MGNAIRRFMNMTSENNVFEFVVDTNNIDPSATNGAENPLRLRLGLDFSTNAGHQFIIRVSDGRPDVVFNRTSEGANIYFEEPGIYTITLIGKSNFFAGPGIDRLKWIYLNRWGSSFKGLSSSAFSGASNLIIRSKESVKLTGNRQYFFNGIKGFSSDFDMSKLDVSDVSSIAGFFQGVQEPLPGALNPFINIATNLNLLYDGVDMSLVNRIEVISSTALTFNYFLRSSGFQGEIIIHSPVSSLFGFMNGVTNPPSMGKIDVRTCSNFGGGWIGGVMSKTNVDNTLLGWRNNFDWSSTSSITRSVSFGATVKYSNNPEVIAAKTFLESKGFTFTNLTME